MSKLSLAELKKALGENAVVSHDKVQSWPGCPTGISALDNFLLWKGFPKGALTLIRGDVGLGGTQLWLQAGKKLTEAGKWIAWINGRDSELYACGARRLRLDRTLWISSPVDLKQKLWAIQEVGSLCLFDLVGCDLEAEQLRSGQLLKLKKLALRYQVALVLFSQTQRSHPFFSLAIEMAKNNLTVVRALHRPTPHFIERGKYADTLPQLTARRISIGR